MTVRALLAAVAALLMCASASGAEPWRPVAQSCVSLSGHGGACAVGRAADGLWKVAVAPGGTHAYGIAHDSAAIMIFDRNPATGVLTQRGSGGCVSESGAGCAQGRGLVSVHGIVISPDGRQLYTNAAGTVSAYDRNPETGDLSLKPGVRGCFTSNGTYGAAAGQCTPVRGAVADNYTIVMSPDGRYVYAGMGAITVLKRDERTGDLTQPAGTAGCVTNGGTDGCASGRSVGQSRQMAITPDGRSMYTVGRSTDTLVVFDRDPATGALRQKAGAAGCIGAGAGCTADPRMVYPQAALASTDNRHVYVSVRTGVLTYRRSGDGSLTLQSCVTDANADGCTDGRNLYLTSYSATSPDGQTVVAGSEGTSGLVVFDRDAGGDLTQRPGIDGCVTRTGAALIRGVLVPGQCGAQPALGSNGQVTFVDAYNLIAGSYGDDSAVAFKRDFYPRCASLSVSVTQNVAAPLAFSCDDPNGDPLTYSIVTNPYAGVLGTIDQSSARVFYNPFSAYAGPDELRYRATANGLPSNEAAIGIDVVAPTPLRVPMARPSTVASPVAHRWTRRPLRANRVRLHQLSVRDLPAGATIRVSCSGRPKCGIKTTTLTRGTSSRLNLRTRKPLRGKRYFRPGQTLEVRISAPAMHTKLVRFKVPKKDLPDLKDFCIPLGAKAVRRSCN